MTDSPNTSIDNSPVNIYPWHKSTWSNFTKAKNQQHLPHAILLSGEQGIGKLKLAERMAKSLLCMNTTETTDACSYCPSCKTYNSAANPDYLKIGLLEEKKQIGVDQIRALSEFLNYSRSYNTHKVVIINPIERLNLNAANSLLKSLEEPTPNTIIILVTAKVSDLLATIKSRCQLFSVNTPSKDETIAWLNQHHNADNNNAIIDAESLFYMVGSKPLNATLITQENIENKYEFFNDLGAVINHSISISDMAKKWEKHDFELLINWQLHSIQNAIKTSLDTSLNDEKEGASTANLSQHLDNEEKWYLYQNLINQKQYIHTSVNPLMYLENMIMLWTKASN